MEFDIIRELTAGAPTSRPDVIVGSGDDAAVLAVPAGHELVLTVDTLIAGRHFPEDTAAADIGWKALAASLSDLAAMGAEPAWITVALSVPGYDRAWLAAFVGGLAELLETSGAVLVGGDLTRGPLSVTVQAAGTVPAGQAITRDGARPGDVIAVTGTLGDAALGLALWPGGAAPADPGQAYLHRRLTRPTPRVDAGPALRGRAHAAIDISDGLAADLGHVLAASGVGARVEADRLPASPAFETLCPAADRRRHQLAGGDDYELCVCLPPSEVEALAAVLESPPAVIGQVEAEAGLRLVDAAGHRIELAAAGYDHFGEQE